MERYILIDHSNGQAISVYNKESEIPTDQLEPAKDEDVTILGLKDVRGAIQVRKAIVDVLENDDEDAEEELGIVDWELVA